MTSFVHVDEFSIAAMSINLSITSTSLDFVRGSQTPLMAFAAKLTSTLAADAASVSCEGHDHRDQVACTCPVGLVAGRKHTVAALEPPSACFGELICAFHCLHCYATQIRNDLGGFRNYDSEHGRVRHNDLDIVEHDVGRLHQRAPQTCSWYHKSTHFRWLLVPLLTLGLTLAHTAPAWPLVHQEAGSEL